MMFAAAVLAVTLAATPPAPAASASSPSAPPASAMPAMPPAPATASAAPPRPAKSTQPTQSEIPMKPMMMPAAAPLPSDVPLGAAARAHLPRTTVTVAGEIAGMYGGVRLADLVRAAGAPAGDVRGRAAAAYLVAHGSDGYVAIYSLAELDSTAERCAPILADTRNGVRIGADVGPLRVVAPCDRRASRSVRNVVALTIGSARPPQH